MNKNNSFQNIVAQGDYTVTSRDCVGMTGGDQAGGIIPFGMRRAEATPLNEGRLLTIDGETLPAYTVSCDNYVYQLDGIVLVWYAHKGDFDYSAEVLFQRFYKNEELKYVHVQTKKPDAYKRDLRQEFYWSHRQEQKMLVERPKGRYVGVTEEEQEEARDIQECYYQYVVSMYAPSNEELLKERDELIAELQAKLDAVVKENWQLQEEKQTLQVKVEKLEAIVSEFEQPDDAIIIRDLAQCFYGIEDDARAFLKQVRAVKDKKKPAIAKKYINQKKLSESSAHRDLWSILVKHSLYGNQESTWNIMLGKA